LKLAIAVREHNHFADPYDGAKIFSELSNMVASCLMLTSARQSFLGELWIEMYFEPEMLI
jgi:hypothetical protein